MLHQLALIDKICNKNQGQKGDLGPVSQDASECGVWFIDF